MSELDQHLAEIRRLLSEAYQHYFRHGDGYCKSAEGRISVDYPAFFWEKSEAEQEPIITIYSYVFASGRRESFDSSAEALEEVRQWHADEMASTYCPGCRCQLSGPDDECWCDVELGEPLQITS